MLNKYKRDCKKMFYIRFVRFRSFSFLSHSCSFTPKLKNVECTSKSSNYIYSNENETIISFFFFVICYERITS